MSDASRMHLEPGADPIACALFVLVAFTCSGLAQTAWFKSGRSARFAVPLDGGRTLRGRRLFGPNKTWKGLVVMLPATAFSFAFWMSVAEHIPGLAALLWPLSPPRAAAVGLLAAAGFMLAELPNSFVKRQLAIEPGAAPDGRALRRLTFVIDRLDSILGMLLTLTLLVPMPWQTWLVILAVGPAIHWSFSVLLHLLGLKPRPA